MLPIPRRPVTTRTRPARAQVLLNDDVVQASHVESHLHPPTRCPSRAANFQRLPVTEIQLNAPDHDRWAVSGRSVGLLVGRTRWFAKGRSCDRILGHELVQHWLWVFDAMRAVVVHTVDRASGHAGRRSGGDNAESFKALSRHSIATTQSLKVESAFAFSPLRPVAAGSAFAAPTNRSVLLSSQTLREGWCSRWTGTRAQRDAAGCLEAQASVTERGASPRRNCVLWRLALARSIRGSTLQWSATAPLTCVL